MKKRKVFINEQDWNEFVMEMRSANIGWEGQDYFQFDIRTAILVGLPLITAFGIIIGILTA